MDEAPQLPSFIIDEGLQVKDEPDQVGIALKTYLQLKIFSDDTTTPIAEKHDIIHNSNLTNGLKRKYEETSPWRSKELEDNLHSRLEYDSSRRRLFDIFAEKCTLNKKCDTLLAHLIPEKIDSVYHFRKLNLLCMDLNVFRKRNILFYCGLYINSDHNTQTLYANKILNALASVESVRNRDEIYDGIVSNNIQIYQSFVKNIVYHPRIVQDTKNRIDTIFQDVSRTLSSIDACLWIERKGILLSCFLEILTPKMSACFIRILEVVHYNFKTYYVDGVIRDLIPVILFKMKEGKLPFIDKLGFLKILVRFLEFRMADHEQNPGKVFPFSNDQLLTSLKFVDDNLGEQGALGDRSVEFFFEAAEYIILLGEAGLKIINVVEDVTIVDPKSDFCFTITSPIALNDLIQIRRSYFGDIPRDVIFAEHRSNLERLYELYPAPPFDPEEWGFKY